MVEFKQPDELKDLIDLSLKKDGTSEQEVLDLCRKVLRYSVHTGKSVSTVTIVNVSYLSPAHPRMYNPLWSGVDTTGFCGVVIATAANTNVYVSMEMSFMLLSW